MNDELYTFMIPDYEKSILDAAIWLVDNKSTIRKTAKEFCIAKSTLHEKIHKYLGGTSSELYACVKRQLNENKAKYFK